MAKLKKQYKTKKEFKQNQQIFCKQSSTYAIQWYVQEKEKKQYENECDNRNDSESEIESEIEKEDNTMRKKKPRNLPVTKHTFPLISAISSRLLLEYRKQN